VTQLLAAAILSAAAAATPAAPSLPRGAIEAPEAPATTPELSAARPVAGLLLAAPLQLGGTLGAAWLGATAVSAGPDASFGERLTKLRDRDAPAQLLFAGSLVLAAPALSALAPWALVEAQPGVTCSYPWVYGAGLAGQLAGLGLTAATGDATGLVLGVALVAIAETAAAVLTATPEEAPARLAPGAAAR